MKRLKTKQFFCILFSALFIAGLFPVRSGHAASFPLPLELTQIAAQLSGPEAIAGYMWKNFRVESDQKNFGREEYWQSPQELLQNRRGDCEDFARFAYELLRAQGRKAWLISLYGRGGYGHTVCIFSEDGFYHVIDGSEVKRSKAKTLSKVFGKIYPFWQKAAMVKPLAGSPRAVIIKEFKKA